MAKSEYDLRCDTLAERLPSGKLDVLIVTGEPNIRYLSGFTGDNGLLLIAPGKVTLLTDPRFQIQASLETTCQVRIAKGPLVTAAIALIRRGKWKRIGYEPARMHCDVFEALKKDLPMGAALEPAPVWIEEMRMLKTPDEIALIRRSVITNSKAFAQAVRHARVGMKEYELAAELEYRMRRLGAEKPSFDTIVASGPRSALPHARPGASVCKSGELVVVDMGAMQDGYCSDMTRMLHLGNPSAKTRRTYRAVLEAQLAAIDAVKAGAATAQVDRAARQVLKSYGLDRAFVHSTGHGLGLEIHEAPRIGRKDKTRLQAGMAITIEPGVYLEGFGGIRIEDTVVVTANGCEILTPTSKELHTI